MFMIGAISIYRDDLYDFIERYETAQWTGNEKLRQARDQFVSVQDIGEVYIIQALEDLFNTGYFISCYSDETFKQYFKICSELVQIIQNKMLKPDSDLKILTHDHVLGIVSNIDATHVNTSYLRLLRTEVCRKGKVSYWVGSQRVFPKKIHVIGPCSPALLDVFNTNHWFFSKPDKAVRIGPLRTRSEH